MTDEPATESVLRLDSGPSLAYYVVTSRVRRKLIAMGATWHEACRKGPTGHGGRRG